MTQTSSFEESLAVLEAKVEELSRGDVPLDRALAAFEEGVALYRRCQEILARAEQRVMKLEEASGALSETPLESE